MSAALATLFEAMNEIGTWDKGMPIFLSRGKVRVRVRVRVRLG